MSLIKMLNFLQRRTTTIPKRKFPTLAEIKEETGPISDEVNLVFTFQVYSTFCVELHLMFLAFQIPNQPPLNTEDDHVDLTGEVGSPVRNLPHQAKVSVFRSFVIKINSPLTKPALNSSVEEQQGTLRRLMLPRENPKIPVKKNKAKNLGPKLSDKKSILFSFRVSTFLNSNIMT